MKKSSYPARSIFLSAILSILLTGSSHMAWAKEPMHIQLIIEDTAILATLEDNAAGRDFWEMLPLTVTMKDYNRTEKISNLPRKLSTKGTPEGFAPAVGDITLYAPWGNLAIFYKDYSWSKGLVLLGHITDGVERLATLQENGAVTFRQAK